MVWQTLSAMHVRSSATAYMDDTPAPSLHTQHSLSCMKAGIKSPLSCMEGKGGRSGHCLVCNTLQYLEIWDEKGRWRDGDREGEGWVGDREGEGWVGDREGEAWWVTGRGRGGG